MRAGLCAERSDWPFTGTIVAGYPDLPLHAEDYWERFWKIYETRTGAKAGS